MKITVTFDSLEELEAFRGLRASASAEPAQSAPETAKAAPAKKDPPKAKAPQKAPAAPEPVQQGDWAPGGSDEPEGPQPEPGKPAITEDYRVEVRKELAALNKRIGHNVAKELIAAFGVAKLTDVRLEDLPALMQKAKEAAG